MTGCGLRSVTGAGPRVRVEHAMVLFADMRDYGLWTQCLSGPELSDVVIVPITIEPLEPAAGAEGVRP